MIDQMAERRNQKEDRDARGKSVAKAAIEAIGDREKAMRWMGKPNVALGGNVPLRLIETEHGTLLVLATLDRIAYGGVT